MWGMAPTTVAHSSQDAVGEPLLLPQIAKEHEGLGRVVRAQRGQMSARGVCRMSSVLRLYLVPGIPCLWQPPPQRQSKALRCLRCPAIQ